MPQKVTSNTFQEDVSKNLAWHIQQFSGNCCININPLSHTTQQVRETVSGLPDGTRDSKPLTMQQG